MRDTESQKHRQREKQAPCREPDVGLDPRTPGSHPTKGRCSTTEHPQASPKARTFLNQGRLHKGGNIQAIS